MLKILQARLQNVNHELPDVQSGFRKGRGTRDQIANIHWIIKKAREFQKNIYSALLTMPKSLTVWITINCGKFWKKWEYQTTWLACLLRNLYASQEATVRTGHGTTVFSSVQSLSCIPLFATPWIAAHQASLSITNLNPRLSSWRCHPAISSSVIPFSSCPQLFPELGSFPISLLFAWGGQSIGVSASTSVLPMNIQDWFPLGWTGWISSQSKGLSRVFSNTTLQKHKFFSTQLSL